MSFTFILEMGNVDSDSWISINILNDTFRTPDLTHKNTYKSFKNHQIKNQQFHDSYELSTIYDSLMIHESPEDIYESLDIHDSLMTFDSSENHQTLQIHKSLEIPFRIWITHYWKFLCMNLYKRSMDQSDSLYKKSFVCCVGFFLCSRKFLSSYYGFMDCYPTYFE